MKRLFVIAFIIPVLTSCHYLNRDRVRGNGNIKTETRSTGAFSSVDAGGNIEVYVKQDSARSVRIEADENLMKHIVIKTEGDRLVIEPEDGYNLSGTRDIKVYVSSPVFNRLEASGASGITSEGLITAERIDVDLNGASTARLELKAPTISAGASGASKLMLKGQTKDLSIEASGASHANCFELLSENADIDVAGASSADVFASVNLKAEASGASHIRYKGAASHTGKSSGASGITKVETPGP